MDKYQLIRFIYSLVLYLSKPYDIQNMEMEDFVRWNLPEEIGLEWDDAGGTIELIQKEGILSAEDILTLYKIRENFIDAFSLDKESYQNIWSHEAMKDHPFWKGQRMLAKRLVESLKCYIE